MKPLSFIAGSHGSRREASLVQYPWASKHGTVLLKYISSTVHQRTCSNTSSPFADPWNHLVSHWFYLYALYPSTNNGGHEVNTRVWQSVFLLVLPVGIVRSCSIDISICRNTFISGDDFRLCCMFFLGLTEQTSEIIMKLGSISFSRRTNFHTSSHFCDACMSRLAQGSPLSLFCVYLSHLLCQPASTGDTWITWNTCVVIFK